MFGKAKEITKIQSIINHSLNSFKTKENEYKYKDYFHFEFIGEKLKSIQFLEQYKILVAKDHETAEDLLTVAVNEANDYITKCRIEKIKQDAKTKGVRESLIDEIFKNEMLMNL